MTTRSEFFARLEPFHAPSTLKGIQLAYTLAKYSHRAQRRKEKGPDGQPLRYFEHVRRVALILIDEVKIVRSEMIIAALLHDGIEDTRDLTPDMIEYAFGTDVTQLVKILSKVPKEGYLERLQGSIDWRPYCLKVCDRLDNIRSLHAGDPSFQQRQIRETREHYLGLANRMVYLGESSGYRPQLESLRQRLFFETNEVAYRLEEGDDTE